MFHSRLSENRARRHFRSAWFFNTIRREPSFLDGLANEANRPLRPFLIVASAEGMRHKRSFASLHRLRGNRRLSARVQVGGTTALGRSRILAEGVERLLYRLPQLPCRRQGVDELVRADEGDMALPRAGPAEPGDSFAAKVFDLDERARRGAPADGAALRARAKGIERHEPRVEGGEPREGFRIEARA